jgi:polysaccharide pyruvyl transferase WcaK-like protein
LEWIEVLLPQKNIAVFGSVGINRGDDLMNRVLVNFFTAYGHSVEAVAMLPEKMATTYGTPYFSSRLKHFRQWLGVIWRSDVVVIGGGTVVQDDFGKTFGGILTYTSIIILASKLFGKKVHAIGIGFNRIKRPASKLFFNAYRFLDTVCIRDESSLQLAENVPWLKGKVDFAPDLAFLKDYYGQIHPLPERVETGKRVLISLVGESHQESALTALACAHDICKQHGMPLVGIAMDDRGSEEISVFETFKESRPDFDYIVPATAEEAVAEIVQSSGVISMRLHASIISLVTERPLVVISRETKTVWIKDWIPEDMFIPVNECRGLRMGAAVEALIVRGRRSVLPDITKRLEANAAEVTQALARIA